ncbi:aspartate/glutamate racemase family protein [Rhizobium tubonense]|uniref:Asp/Glu racemase n=1 Tax=Rhizobium tubonense TaxID=484088 RepID=A0A2W4CY71_9HYPH|nr:aspartate/glutamate racemase family protein [Rhizobium tubonense]PZM17162.1 Asp/Glu racemase [Rhizobium tubonense]
MTIACLHTHESNIPAFEEAAERLGLPAGTLRHTVRADLLDAAQIAGGLTAEIEAETRSVLTMLGQDVDGVLLTCSTLGPAAEIAVHEADTPILRADAALAQKAVAGGGSVVVLCTLETTIDPTTALFAEAARTTGATIDVRLIAGAWDLFKANDKAGYFEAIAEATDAAYAEGASVVALGQMSMSGAIPFVKGPRMPLAGQAVALQALVARIPAL